MEEPFVNKVAESGLITLDPAEFYPTENIRIFDLKDHLFMGLILKEKDFRAALQSTDWIVYQDCAVGIICSADAIIPLWAYMLVASALEPYANFIIKGNEDQVREALFLRNIADINPKDYSGQRVVVKGCGEKTISEAIYVAITQRLRPEVKSIFFGEPCSTVPVYKKK
ncbi:MAG: DUF2480 family protein [Bacteroidota bacterium]